MVKQAIRTIDGMAFPADAFASVPDASKPGTWKLLLFDAPEDVRSGKPSARRTAAAVMALSPMGFRGNRVRIPASSLEDVKRRVRAAWTKARRGSSENMPAAIKAATASGAVVKVDDVEIEVESLEEAERFAASQGGEILRELAVPQDGDKADLSTGALASGGAFQPAQGSKITRALPNPEVDATQENEIVKTDDDGLESVGIFMRVPKPLSDKFPASRGNDDSPPHATILQAGRLDLEQFDKLLLTAQSLLKTVDPFDVELTDFGQFRSHTGQWIPHVIPRAKGTDLTFEALHALLCDSLTEAGFDGCQRMDPFKPHVTIDYLEDGESYTGGHPEGTFKLSELEVWGAPGGTFGRRAIEFGTGKIVREVSSTKRGADFAAPQVKSGFVPPQSAADAAERGLELRQKFRRGGTAVGIMRARDLKNRASLSLETIGRMVSFFARHGAQGAGDPPAPGEDPDAGYIAWLLWGGDPGMRWAKAIWDREQRKDKADGPSVPASPSDQRVGAGEKRAFQILSKAEGEEERTVFGIVLEPETVDSQNDIYDEDEIRKTAYRFMERYQQFGLMHQDIVSSILPLESYLAPVDFEIGGQKVQKGTWLLRVRVLDDTIWEQVRSGELTGFSIGGSAMRTPDTVELDS